MKRIHFDLELAKAITNGEKEGRIITRSNRVVEIKYIIDVACDYPVICLIGNKVVTCTKNGYYNNNAVEREYDLFLEVPDEQEFKEGDVLCHIDEDGLKWIFILKKIEDEKVYIYFDISDDYKSFTGFIDYLCNMKNLRLATFEEKQQLIDALKKDGSDKAREYLKRFLGIEWQEQPYNCFKETKAQKFNAGDEVLVRGSNTAEWCYAQYSHYSKNDNEHIAYGYGWLYCIPYNDQTKHLLGTTNDWKE